MILSMYMYGKSVAMRIIFYDNSFIENFNDDYRTQNGWYFRKGGAFQVSKDLTIIPDKITAHNDVFRMIYHTESDRYNCLKEFSEALLELSGSNFFDDVEKFSNKARIKYDNLYWAIY